MNVMFKLSLGLAFFAKSPLTPMRVIAPHFHTCMSLGTCPTIAMLHANVDLGTVTWITQQPTSA